MTESAYRKTSPSEQNLKEKGPEEIRQIISNKAEEISTYIKRIDPEKLQNILEFYIFGFREEENEQVSLLIEEVNKADFEAYMFRVGAFVLISQMLFYAIYERNENQQTNPKHQLPALSNAKTLLEIEEDFRRLRVINYEHIFGIDLLSEILLIDDPDLIGQCFFSLKFLADLLGIVDHDLIIRYDILGKLYHSLIPERLRKTIAAYYTKYIVARFILEFILRDNTTGPMMDPTCGSGTFLISAYQKINELHPSLDHTTILKSIYGNDITSFAALLATINLAFQDIRKAPKRCFVSRGDIFDLKNRVYVVDEYVKKKKADSSFKEIFEEDNEGYQIPKIQSIVGNPPFTKGDRLPQNYKARLRDYFDVAGKIEPINKNMPLHGYILLDLDRYLKKGGNIGLILPLTTLYIDLLEKIRLYLLNHYTIEYVITSEVEPFSEDTDQKEVILIATLAGNVDPIDFDIKFVSLKRELTKENYATFATKILENTTDTEGEFFRINHIKKSELVGNKNWSLYFNAKQKVALFDLLTGNPKIGTVKSIENERIKAFRGFRQLITEHWMVPNRIWNLGRVTPTSIEIVSKTTPTSTITLQADFFLPGLTSSGDFDLPVITKVNGYILKNDGGDAIQNPELKEYAEFVKKQVNSEDFKAFLKQVINIGKRFNYSGRIAFPHRFDLETGRILCFLAPKRVGLGQNWHTIRGLAPDYENFLVAWFNSSLFLLSLLVSRRQQRGPFGQTAVGEFKSYLIPLPHTIPAEEQRQVFTIFEKLNSSTLLNLTIKEQLELTLKEDNERRALDKSLMDALGILPHDEVRQSLKLNELYAMIAKEIDIMKQQRKNKAPKPSKGNGSVN